MKLSIVAGFLLLATALTEVQAVQCYEGTATINQATSGANCTDQEKGYYNSSAGPLTHQGCTDAKADARAKLTARIQESCRPYVQSFQPCQAIPLSACPTY